MHKREDALEVQQGQIEQAESSQILLHGELNSYGIELHRLPF